MLFDVGSAELPTATLRSRGRVTALALDLRSWLAARWRWFRPRSIPVGVALLGMICVLQSVSYLSRVPATVIEAANTPSVLVVMQGPDGADIVLDPNADGSIGLQPGVYRIQLTSADR